MSFGACRAAKPRHSHYCCRRTAARPTPSRPPPIFRRPDIIAGPCRIPYRRPRECAWNSMVRAVRFSLPTTATARSSSSLQQRQRRRQRLPLRHPHPRRLQPRPQHRHRCPHHHLPHPRRLPNLRLPLRHPHPFLRLHPHRPPSLRHRLLRDRPREHSPDRWRHPCRTSQCRLYQRFLSQILQHQRRQPIHP